MATRSSSQMQLIQSLRLHYDETYCDWIVWNDALNMTLIKTLRDLRRLRLSIEMTIQADTYACLKRKGWPLIKSFPHDGFERLSTLPLEKVEISIRNHTDPCFANDDESDNNEALWTDADKKEYANDIQRMLLNPKGAETYVEEQRKKEALPDRRNRKHEEALDALSKNSLQFSLLARQAGLLA